MISIKRPFLLIEPVNRPNSHRVYYEGFNRFFLIGAYALSALMVAYCILSRNIFDAGDYLFTIIGFDMLTVLYLYNRPSRKSILNIAFFILLACLFIYAGFRYRIVLLVCSELFCLDYRRYGFLKAGLLISVLAFGLFWFSAFAAVRSYGSFSLPPLSSVDFDVKSALVSGGEATVTRATIAIADSIDQIDLYGLEPVQVLLTHYIPAAIYPSKPRAVYLETYFVVAPELKGTGAAMHDMAQYLGMFGAWGLPFVSLFFGCLWGAVYSFTCRLAPNRYVVAGLMTLFGFLLPSRGYLAQQVTWALSFIVILYLLRLGFAGAEVESSREGQRGEERYV